MSLDTYADLSPDCNPIVIGQPAADNMDAGRPEETFQGMLARLFEESLCGAGTTLFLVSGWQ